MQYAPCMLKMKTKRVVDKWPRRYRLGGAGMGQVVRPWVHQDRFVALTAPSPRLPHEPEQLPGAQGDPAFRKEGHREDQRSRRSSSAEQGEDMETLFIGLDVAKDHLDVAVYPTEQNWQVPNTAEGIAGLTAALDALAPACIVLEPSGGYEQEAAATLATAGLPLAVVNARQVRDFAKATGQLAKTDRLDARILARFAEAIRPAIRPLPDADAEELRSLLVRRTQVVSMTTAEKNRLKTANRAVRPHIKAHIAWLEEQREALDSELGQRLKESPVWREKEQLLRSIKGIGPVASFTLLAALPELGRLTHKEIAALSGLAPLARDSGTLRGKRTIWGGRARVRQGLYMAAVCAAQHNPIIRAFYERLISRGKPKKVALTACMHKLLILCNAVLRTGTPWDPDYVRAHAA